MIQNKIDNEIQGDKLKKNLINDPIKSHNFNLAFNLD